MTSTQTGMTVDEALKFVSGHTKRYRRCGPDSSNVHHALIVLAEEVKRLREEAEKQKEISRCIDKLNFNNIEKSELVAMLKTAIATIDKLEAENKDYRQELMISGYIL